MSEYQKPNENKNSIRKVVACVVVTFLIILAIVDIRRLSMYSHRDHPRSFGRENESSEKPRDPEKELEEIFKLMPSQEKINLIKDNMRRSTIKFTDYSASMFAEPWRLYDFLGIPITATPEEINRGFKVMALKVHPDKQGPDSGKSKEYFENAFQIVEKCHSILSDEKKRRVYDTFAISCPQTTEFDFTEEMEKFNKSRIF